MKMNRNYKKVGKKIWRVLKCKEIVGLRFWKFVFADNLEYLNYFFDQLEPTFLGNVYAYNGKPLFHLVETSSFYLSMHPG